MKLTELDPGWIVEKPGRQGMGVSFMCPCCRDIHLAVWFANPIDGGPPAHSDIDPKPRWVRTGETFETLTVTPSIDASQSGHWHGYIRSGELI
jgi:hypothetical protein